MIRTHALGSATAGMTGTYTTCGGVVIPQIATEHGYEPRWRQDTRYPEITRGLHCEYNLELVQQVQEGEVGDAFFAGCFWHLAAGLLGNVTFPWSAWLDSKYSTGGELPIVQALKDRPKKVRRFSWEKKPAVRHGRMTVDVRSGDLSAAADRPRRGGMPVDKPVNLYRQWADTPGNANSLTGPEGMMAFLAHLAALGIPATIERAYQEGYPSSPSAAKAEEKLQNVQRVKDALEQLKGHSTRLSEALGTLEKEVADLPLS